MVETGDPLRHYGFKCGNLAFCKHWKFFCGGSRVQKIPGISNVNLEKPLRAQSVEVKSRV